MPPLRSPRLHLPPLALPPSAAALALFAAAFVLPGLAGHDPWKTHDAIAIGIAHGMVVSGDGIVPRVAGLPWLHDPPLYHWLAVAFGRVLQPLIEFHSAARLASGALVGAAFYLIFLAAREWQADERKREAGAAACLLLLGSLGLMVHAHEALPELAALAALCGALATLPHASRRPLAAGVLFGAALGCAFLSANWIAPLALGLSVAAAHLVCEEWRNRGGLVFTLSFLAVAALLASSWPLALYARSPALFAEWWSLATHPQTGYAGNLRYFLSTASWFTWPAWPIAGWALWSLRRRLAEPRLFVPFAASVTMLAAVSFWGPPQDVNLLLLLPPLALLAAQGALVLRRGAAGALDWFGVLAFGFFTGLVWLGWFAMLTGLPPQLAAYFMKTAPGFTLGFRVLPFLFSLALVAGWLYIMLYSTRSPVRSVARWAAGIVLLWGSFSALWMPWADHQKGYRSVALQLRSKIPVDGGCLAQRSLGISQAAALDYHAGIRPQPFDPLKPTACPLLLVQGSPQHDFDGPGAGWTKLADVGRPGDRSERYRLYRFSK
jgi:4-amino-4-deoxy-L-arabinose transferase-like glycosyltransferase